MKKLATILALAICIPGITSAQSKWTAKQSLGASLERADAMSFSLNGKIYVAGGANEQTAFMDFWEYDPGMDRWTQKADLLHFAYRGAATFTIGNKGYIVTGQRGATGFTLGHELYEYDPAADKWTQKASLATIFAEERTQAIGFSVNGKGYLGGGYFISSSQGGGGGAFAHADLFEYDPATDKWTYKTDLGGISATLNGKRSGMAVSLGNYAYVAGGCNGEATITYTDFYRYSPSTNKWDTLESLPTALAESSAFALGTDIYVVGGSNFPSTTGTTICYRYSTVTGKWTTDTSFPLDVTASVAGTANGKAYMGMGSDDLASDNIRNDWYEFTPATVSVGTNTPASNISVYPNPAKDHISVTGITPGTTIKLTDLTGREVFGTIAASNTEKIGTHMLAAGTYILRVEHDGYSGVEKITIYE